MKYFKPSSKTVIVFFFLLFLTFNPHLLKSQVVEGNFKGISAEKINGNFYVLGYTENNEIKVAKYDDKLDLVKEVTKQLPDKIKTFLGFPSLSQFTQRNLLDIRVVYKSGIVAWLTYDLNLNEIGFKEYDFSKDKKDVSSETNIYNPVYSEGSYISNYGIQKTVPGFYTKNNFYHFLTNKSAEFTNLSTEKYSYYKGEPAFRKLEKVDNSSSFYKEVKRVNLSETDFFKDFNPKKYNIQFVNQKDGFLYFLASKQTNVLAKDDVRLIKINENSLDFEKSIDLSIDSLYPDLGNTLMVNTYFDSINQRIIQIGSYTGMPFQKYWWHSTSDLDHPSLQCKGFYICEFDLIGKVKQIKKFDFPKYDLNFTSLGNRFNENKKAFYVPRNGIVFQKDGGIKLIGENSILSKFTSTSGNMTSVGYGYIAIAESFINIKPDLELADYKVVNKEKAKKNLEYDDVLEEFKPSENINDALALFTQKEGSEETQKRLIYSGYYGMKYLKVDFSTKLFLYSNENSVIFNSQNNNGKFEFRFSSNKD